MFMLNSTAALVSNTNVMHIVATTTNQAHLTRTLAELTIAFVLGLLIGLMF